MKKHTYLYFALALATLVVRPVIAQTLSTPPASKEELDALYNTSVENRTTSILQKLNLADGTKSNAVHDVIVGEYHSLHARDEAIDAKLKAQGLEINFANRASQMADTTKALHDDFLAKLSALLTPDQVDQVKDLMTYNKVSFTYNAYCNIVPNLTDADKARIMDWLKQAREEAISGGNAAEKSQIFQKYKDKIDAYLNDNGHDVAKAKADWLAAHPTNSAATTAAAINK